MNLIEKFLSVELDYQEMYDEIINFITSFHIRNGEFEGNEYIINKMDRDNFIIYLEYDYSNNPYYRYNGREINSAIAIDRKSLIKVINEYAIKNKICIKNTIEE